MTGFFGECTNGILAIDLISGGRLPLSNRAASPPPSRPARLTWAHAAHVAGLLRVDHPLVAPFAALWLAFAGIGVLLYSPALRVYRAGDLAATNFLRDTAYVLSPDVLLTAARDSAGGVVVSILYLLLALSALAAWMWALRIAAETPGRSPRNLLILTGLLCLPAIGFVGLFSDDVYLYNLYGRTIAEYGSNPLVHRPAAFTWDPHLPWVYWKELPSSYGPIWLMLSGALSALASDSITGVVLWYRGVALAIHLATAAAIWQVMRQIAPRDARAATLFYAWNPLVILEVVANAHNDVLVALLAVLLVTATVQRAWGHAAFFGACAVMVKPFAVLLLPGLALRIYQTRSSRAGWIRHTAAAVVIGVLSLAALSLPLYAGLRLLDNIAGNPASFLYTNTLWELLSWAGPWVGVSADHVQHRYFDAIRTACFLVGTVWIVSRRWTRRGAAHVALSLWILFLLTASWVWPWYFVPAIALAALARGAGLAAATALTAGGLVFWAGWPPPSAIPGLYMWRSVLLFGPLLATIAVPAVRLRILELLGAGRRHGTDGLDLVTAPRPAPSSASNQPSSAAAAS
jgi:hypothetical protein